MKKYLMVVLVLVGFMSCNLGIMVKDIRVDSSTMNRLNIPLSKNTPFLEKPKDAIKFLHENMTYTTSYYDEWQSLDTSFELGSGDCEDFAIAYLNLVYNCFGIKGDLVLLDSAKAEFNGFYRAINEGGYYNHVAVLVDGIIYDPTTRVIVDCPIAFTYAFNEVFNL